VLAGLLRFARNFIKIETMEVTPVVNWAYAAAPAAAAAPEASPMWSFVVPMIFMVVIFYFLLIRPQQRKAKEHKALLDNLKKGDRIISSGGIIGTIVSIDDQIVNVEIADRVRIEMARPYIAGFAPKK
jgi:preprotein translocase subunit YajC